MTDFKYHDVANEILHNNDEEHLTIKKNPIHSTIFLGQIEERERRLIEPDRR